MDREIRQASNYFKMQFQEFRLTGKLKGDLKIIIIKGKYFVKTAIMSENFISTIL